MKLLLFYAPWQIEHRKHNLCHILRHFSLTFLSPAAVLAHRAQTGTAYATVLKRLKLLLKLYAIA